MKILILGATGMLGQALVPEGLKRGHEMVTKRVDLTDSPELIRHLHSENPDVVINAAAMTDLSACEEDPTLAHLVNVAPLETISAYMGEMNIRPKLIQISSDQAVEPLNQYALSKRLAEEVCGEDALIVRTNIVGFRGHGRPTFAEWAIEVIENDLPVTLFNDYYTSSIDVWAFSDILFDLIERYPTIWGRINIASRNTSTKQEFIEALARRLKKWPSHSQSASIDSIQPRRPKYCGLDVTHVETLLGRMMPSMDEVVNAIVERRNLYVRTDCS